MCFSFTSCYKKYIGTRAVCGNSLYAELYEINPAGVDAFYLTDSTNFRTYVGRFDPEIGNYEFSCKGNYVCIEKINRRNQYILDTVDIIVGKTVLNLDSLRQQHRLD